MENNKTNNQDVEITLKELFNVIWSKRYLLILVFVLGFVVFGIGGYVYNKSNETMSTYVSLQWDGIGKGEYPNGERFDYTEAVEPYVIQLAIDAQSLDLSAQEVREAIELTPVVPNDVEALIATALESGEQISYFATEYKVNLNFKDLKLTEAESRSLIEEIIVQFRIDFEKKYINQAIILDYTGIDFTDLEYTDIATVFDTQISLIEAKMATGLEANPGYTSSAGISFSDIIVRSDLINTIELSQIKSRTNTYLLTKDEEYVKVNYQYQIELKELELTKETQIESDLQSQIDNYAGSLTTIVIPGYDDVLDIDPYYDTLLTEIIAIQSSLAELESDLAYLQLQLDRLNGVDPNFTVTEQKQAEEIIIVETFISSADTKLSSVVEDANLLLDEYNQYLTSNIIKPLMSPVVSNEGLSTLVIAAIGSILVAGTATLVVLFKHDWN